MVQSRDSTTSSAEGDGGDDEDEEDINVYVKYGLPRNRVGDILAFGLRHPEFVRKAVYLLGVGLLLWGVISSAAVIGGDIDLSFTGNLSEVESNFTEKSGVKSYVGKVEVVNMSHVRAVETGEEYELVTVLIPDSSPSPERFGMNNTSTVRNCLSDVHSEGVVAYNGTFNGTEAMIVDTTSENDSQFYLATENHSRLSYLFVNGYAMPPWESGVQENTTLGESVKYAKTHDRGLWRCGNSTRTVIVNESAHTHTHSPKNGTEEG